MGDGALRTLERRRIGESSLFVTELGFGGAPIGNLYAPVADDDAAAALGAFWEVGVRFFDTAPLYGYGLSERRVGGFLGGHRRSDFVLSTKVGRLLVPRREELPDDSFPGSLPFEVRFDYSYDGVMRSFEASLGRLGLERIDLLLLHDIDRFTHGEEAHAEIFEAAMAGAVPALRRLRTEGLVQAIGLGVNEWQVAEATLARTDLDCVLLAGRYSLLDQESLQSFLPLCLERKVSVIAGGAFNSGLLADPSQAAPTYDYAPAPPELIERARRIQHVCEGHGVPIQAAALQFPLEHPAVSALLAGVRTAREAQECLAWLREPIPQELWRELKAEGLLHPGAPTERSGAG